MHDEENGWRSQSLVNITHSLTQDPENYLLPGTSLCRLSVHELEGISFILYRDLLHNTDNDVRVHANVTCHVVLWRRYVLPSLYTCTRILVCRCPDGR